MTLLELLVAIAIMVAVVGLTGALWAQTGDWAADSALHERTLRLEHARSLFERQWRERRPAIRLDSVDGGPVALRPDRFEFVTGRPALFPEAGLVRASYLLQPVGGDPSRLRLVYEEHRLLRPEFSERRERDELGAPAVDRVVLLDDCADLRWERLIAEPVERRPGEAEPAQPEYAWRTPAERDERTAPDADAADGERPTDIPAGPRAVRLAGVFQESEFQWTVALEPSR
jgi:hypothetical protein